MAMKILGSSPVVQRTIEVPIGKDAKGRVVNMTMRPVKFSVLMEIERDLPDPIPPSTGIKKVDPVTKQPVRRNGQYVMVRDEEDAEYKAECDLVGMAMQVATVVASLGDQLGGLRERTPELSSRDYWLKVFDDLLKIGIDQGIFKSLAAAAHALSEPMSNLELLLMRQALGTDKETDETTDEKVEEAIEAEEKERAKGKA